MCSPQKIRQKFFDFNIFMNQNIWFFDFNIFMNQTYVAYTRVVELTRTWTWTWKSRIVAIFLRFLTLWHVLTYKQADATLASLSILKYEALKWPHGVIRGSKMKSASILFKSMSDRRPWLKNSKNVIIVQMRHMVLTLGVVKGQRLVFRLHRGQKIKLLRFSWKWWHIVHLPIGIQKKNSLHYLQCLLHMFLDKNVTGHHSAMQ